MDGVTLTPLKIIDHPKGDILQALKFSEQSYCSFGEAYFTTIKEGEIKGWKKHKKMILNLIVPSGKVKFVIYDDRNSSNTFGEFYEIVISNENYSRLTVQPELWLGFQGLYLKESLILNIASVEHQADEAENESIDKMEYQW